MRERLVLEAQGVLDFCREHGFTVATAESCTGGLVAAYLTHIAGASDIVERGFVTYSNDSKTELLGVDAQIIAEHGAVSRQTALAMAAGALWRSKASVSVAVTGVAGPGGGSEDKPVGLVHFAIARRVSVSREQLDFKALHHEEQFGDIGRAEVREASVATAFKMLRQAASL
jgi:nicotinamide-nucleotide amidase